jgi:hypothetical protein
MQHFRAIRWHRRLRLAAPVIRSHDNENGVYVAA